MREQSGEMRRPEARWEYAIMSTVMAKLPVAFVKVKNRCCRCDFTSHALKLGKACGVGDAQRALGPGHLCGSP